MKPDIKKEWAEFDWSNPGQVETFKKTPPVSILQTPPDETPHDRKIRMLIPLSNACQACSMCDLGTKPALKNNIEYDPHVFSNMRPTNTMVVDQNPRWNEVKKNVPLVGKSGDNFNKEIEKHKFTRDDFYICNAVRCYTGAEEPTANHMAKCEPFLQMEVSLIKPRLIVALGPMALEQLCPGSQFSEVLGTLVKSRYGTKVLPIHHPSPRNLDVGGNRSAFVNQISLLCSLMKAMVKSKPDT